MCAQAAPDAFALGEAEATTMVLASTSTVKYLSTHWTGLGFIGDGLATADGEILLWMLHRHVEEGLVLETTEREPAIALLRSQSTIGEGPIHG